MEPTTAVVNARLWLMFEADIDDEIRQSISVLINHVVEYSPGVSDQLDDLQRKLRETRA